MNREQLKEWAYEEVKKADRIAEGYSSSSLSYSQYKGRAGGIMHVIKKLDQLDPEIKEVVNLHLEKEINGRLVNIQDRLTKLEKFQVEHRLTALERTKDLYFTRLTNLEGFQAELEEVLGTLKKSLCDLV